MMRLKTRLFTIALVLSLCLLLALGCQQAAPPLDSDGKSQTFELTVDLLGKTYTVLLDSEGKIESRAELSSDDGTVILSIDAGTTFLDKRNKPLSEIQVEIDTDLLPLPENTIIVGAIYKLKPQEAILRPALKLIISYDPNELPQGVRESDVYIAPYDEATGCGRYSYKRVDTERHQVTTLIDRMTRHAVLVPITAASSEPAPKPPSAPDLTSIPLQQALSSGLPTLAEFGRGICVPCKAMKPILEELATEYEGKLNVVIVEIDDHMDQTQEYEIMAIPTQIFFASSGQEITRHMGFYAKDDIIAQLKKMGIE